MQNHVREEKKQVGLFHEINRCIAVSNSFFLSSRLHLNGLPMISTCFRAIVYMNVRHIVLLATRVSTSKQLSLTRNVIESAYPQLLFGGGGVIFLSSKSIAGTVAREQGDL